MDLLKQQRIRSQLLIKSLIDFNSDVKDFSG
jgi:hypothetical protein